MFFRSFFGAFVSRLILTAQNDHAPISPAIQNNQNVALQYLNVNSTHGARINFCELRHTTQQLPLQKRKIIIHAEGNFQRYESFMNGYVNEARRHPECTIVAFNYRNVGESRGIATSQNDWIEDAVSVVNYYRVQGVPTENILLNGYSLSGAILTLAAAKIYAQDKAQNNQAKSLKLINNRSFSDLSEMVMRFFLPGRRKAILNTFIYLACTALYFSWPMTAFLTTAVLLSSTVSESIACQLLKPWIKLILWLNFGTLNAIKAYNSLPASAKDYIVAKNDQNIQERPSLHLALKPQRTIAQRQLRESMVGKTGEQIQKLAAELTNIKDCKLVGDPGINEHLVNLSFLRTAHQNRTVTITGEQVMDNKIRRLLATL